MVGGEDSGCRGDGGRRIEFVGVVGGGGAGVEAARARPRAGGAWERWRACWAGRWAGPRQPHNSAVLPSFSGDNDYEWALFACLFIFPFLRLGS